MSTGSYTIGMYLPGKSLLHRLDPRTKILAVVLFSVAVLLPRQISGFAAPGAICLFGLLLSRAPVRLMLKTLRPIVILAVIVALFNLFFTPGEPLYRIGSWAITREGVILAVVAVLRLVLLVLAASVLTMTTSPIRLTDGLERLLKPFSFLGIPAHELALMMTIALRFIPTLVEETDRIMRAQAARGGDFSSTNLMRRARALLPVMVPLFVAAFRRADELATAMEARGYRGGQGRTKMQPLAYAGRDYATFAAMALLVGGLWWLRRAGLA